ncbi:MAG: radical SAM/SPASM domain-containing protein [Proteobacteria bacterium]|nr:radical SAM/SPASM domain-containing protein [Pseudomonadota bacterium]NBP13677.1 radical SAM/SPASM domain-containing protein [bacterium]
MINIVDRIKNEFATHKIKNMQLDPNGFCNAGCWFCPVRYRGNPKDTKSNMPVDLLEKIFADIIQERDNNGLVDKSFNGFYTSHYNEILLYKHFEDLLRVARKYKLIFMVLSNGTPLTPQKTDLLIEYKDVISGVCLNVPCFEAEVWAKRVNLSESLFPRLIENIQYFIDHHPMQISIQVNGWDGKNDWLEKGENFPQDLLDDENERQTNLAKKLFPKANVFQMPHLIDRAGSISDVITNKHAIDKYHKGKQVVGCLNSGESGGRPVGWIHVNALGECFLCCNDIEMEMKFGDFKTQNLKDFWGKEDHIQTIVDSYEGICANCASAKYE